MRVYIAGPITGTSDYAERFQAAEIELIKAGHKPVNPVKLCEKLGPDCSHEVYMHHCLPFLLECDGYFLLDGWEASKGAYLEKFVADSCGIPEIEVKVLSRKW